MSGKETSIGSQERFYEWVSGQQYLFEGSQGSGKTSLLKRIEAGWPNHLAVYHRFYEAETSYWDSWNKRVGEECSQKYFGTYLEYLLLDLFLCSLRQKELNDIGGEKSLFRFAGEEERLVNDLLQQGFPGERRRLPEQSLWALMDIIRYEHLSIRDRVFEGLSEKAMYETFPVLSPGSLVQCFGESLITNYRKLPDLKVFPLLDDCDRLTKWQTQVINAAVVKAACPISYKLTSLPDQYRSRTTIDGRPMGEDEIRTIRISATGVIR